MFCCLIMAPMNNAEVLSSVPTHEKAVMGLTEEMCVLDKLHSRVNYSAIGREFNVNESTIHIK